MYIIYTKLVLNSWGICMPLSPQAIASYQFKTLDLSGKSFAEGSAAAFANAFKQNKIIERLILSDSSIDDQEFEIIAQGIVDRNQTLELLELDDNFLTPTSMPMLQLLIEKKISGKSIVILCESDSHGS
jgi:Ran GTPase-activating protein (RanGAP) involved in mRNA processing and transport